MKKLIWRLDVEFTDPKVVGKGKEEKEIIKKFDNTFKVLVKGFRMTRTYRLGLMKINRKVLHEE